MIALLTSAAFLVIFITGEIAVNITFFKYLKNYFKIREEATPAATESPGKFFGLEISTFKGGFERFVLFVGLVLDFTQVLVVFGAIKIGTRFEKNDKVKNDYFLIGNFSTILFVILYNLLYQKAENWLTGI